MRRKLHLDLADNGLEGRALLGHFPAGVAMPAEVAKAGHHHHPKVPAGTVAIDTTSADYAESGAWDHVADRKGVGGQYAVSADDTALAQFHANLDPSKTYELYATWVPRGDLAEFAAVRATRGGFLVLDGYVNQQHKPAHDLHYQHHWYQDVGPVGGGDVNVYVARFISTGPVEADAIVLVPKS